MGTSLLRGVALLILCGSLVSSASAGSPSPEQLIAQIKAVEVPSADSKLPADVAKRQKAGDQKARLILQLYKAYPTNPELVRLMPDRWQSRPSTPASMLATRAELDEILLKNKNEKLVAEAAYFKAVLAIRKAGATPRLDDVLPAIDELGRRSPQDERTAQLLFQVASTATDKARQTDLFQRIQKHYPGSPAAKKVEASDNLVSIPTNRDEMIGKPFALEFTDAIKGSPVSIEGLKGKVVVVDFWATWCPPCVAEMPKMKELYAKYKDQGVEFVGVSLDQPKDKGGLDALKSYVEKNKIEWPQFYQGNGWQSDFSMSWGVNSIPCVFLVDADGKLASTEARGKLEEMIPELLAKAKKGDSKTETKP